MRVEVEVRLGLRVELGLGLELESGGSARVAGGFGWPGRTSGVVVLGGGVVVLLLKTMDSLKQLYQLTMDV